MLRNDKPDKTIGRRFGRPTVDREERMSLLQHIHRDERGTISIASVFGLLMIVFLLGMVMNSARQVDRKVKMQNAADAATEAGVVQAARSMNSLAFTNHLLSDVFALTAFFRAAEQRDAEEPALEVLAHWRRLGPELSGAEFPRFADLGNAIDARVNAEEELVIGFSAWAAEAAVGVLPVLESILSEEAIPNFQRELIWYSPYLAQTAADQIVQVHGVAWPRQAEVRAVLWRTNGTQLDSGFGLQSFLPVVDPVLGSEGQLEYYFASAQQQRSQFAHRYLADWNDESMRFIDRYAQLSQFGQLWRMVTCDHLERLLDEEYPNSNLPMQLKRSAASIASRADDEWSADFELRSTDEFDYMLVGVVYSEPLFARIPRLFSNPLRPATMAYAQGQYFVPRRRLVFPTVDFIDPPFAGGVDLQRHSGGLPGTFIDEPEPFAPRVDLQADHMIESWYEERVIHRQSASAYPARMDLMTQNWESQLVPATCQQLSSILSTPPAGSSHASDQWPDVSHLTPDQLQWINHH